MSCLTVADLLADSITAVSTAIGVTVTYYPVTTTVYNTATQVRTPTEGTAVSVVGIFGTTRITAPDDAMTRQQTFTFTSEDYSGSPTAGDRIVDADSFSYRVTEVKFDRIGTSLKVYTLALEN